MLPPGASFNAKDSHSHQTHPISIPWFSIDSKSENAVIGQEIPDEIGPFEIVTDILDDMSSHELQAAFRSWIERV
jgi:hypothetical protein